MAVKMYTMLLALMKVFIFLCILIVPLRGPARRRELGYDQPERTKVFSSYGINKHGRLEKIEKGNEK